MTPEEFKNVQNLELIRKRSAEINKSIVSYTRSILRKEYLTDSQKIEWLTDYIKKKTKELDDFDRSLEWQDE